MKRPYKVRNYKIVGTFAVILSGSMAAMYIIPGTNCTMVWQEWIIVGGWTLLGLILAYLSKKKYKKNFAQCH